MPDKHSDFTHFSGDEIIHLQKENQAASSGLRLEMRAMLDNRLARKITKGRIRSAAEAY
jgi:hypothetical protein